MEVHTGLLGVQPQLALLQQAEVEVDDLIDRVSAIVKAAARIRICKPTPRRSATPPHACIQTDVA